MDYVSAAGLGTALSMDAMAVSITCGMNGRNKKTAFLTTGSTRSYHKALSIFSLFLLEKQNTYMF